MHSLTLGLWPVALALHVFVGDVRLLENVSRQRARVECQHMCDAPLSHALHVMGRRRISWSKRDRPQLVFACQLKLFSSFERSRLCIPNQSPGSISTKCAILCTRFGEAFIAAATTKSVAASSSVISFQLNTKLTNDDGTSTPRIYCTQNRKSAKNEFLMTRTLQNQSAALYSTEVRYVDCWSLWR